MSYQDRKRERERALVAVLHPGFPIMEETSPGFDGGVRGELPHEPNVTGLSGPFPNAEHEPGWPVAFELEDGAALLFPWIAEGR